MPSKARGDCENGRSQRASRSADPPIIFGGEFKGGGIGCFLELENIAWRIEPGREDPNNPLITPKYPWDCNAFGCGHGTVLKDPIDGRYKAWMSSLRDPTPGDEPGHAIEFRLSYAVSEDGVNWERPELNLCAWEGYPKTNILFDFDSGGPSTYASVFVDPEENADEPYEMFVFRGPGEQVGAPVVAGFEGRGAGPGRGLYRYRSRNGIDWRGIEGPLDLDTGDSCYVHREPRGGYVAHHKGGGMPDVPAPVGGRVPYDIYCPSIRISQMRTSDDGTHWSATTPIMFPDWMDAPGDQIMEVGRYPYGDGYIAVMAVYHAMSQQLDLQFAASQDGVNWWRPIPRRPCVPLAPLGDYGGGQLWPSRTLIEDGDQLHLYYGALQGLHGDLYSNTPTATSFYGGLCRASWTKGRMWAAVPGGGGLTQGAMVAYPATPGGRTLCINGVTVDDGQIEVELFDASPEAWPEEVQKVERVPAKIVDGYARSDCDPFHGDHKCKAITFHGREEIPIDRPVCVKFRLHKARLYGFDWR